MLRSSEFLRESPKIGFTLQVVLLSHLPCLQVTWYKAEVAGCKPARRTNVTQMPVIMSIKLPLYTLLTTFCF